MLKKIIIIFLIVLSITNVVHSEEKDSFYSQLNMCVVRLEHFVKQIMEGSNQIKEDNKSDGTGFFIRYGKDLYIVTARHVAEQDYDLHVRVICKNKKTGQNEVILLKLPRNRWVFHPNQGDEDTRYVDIAIMKLRLIQDRYIKAFRYEPSESDKSKYNQLSFSDPEPPTSVLVFGFPLDIGFILLEQKPFGRLGIVSMITGKKFLKIENKFVDGKAYIINVNLFSGNSGSPVINSTKVELLGIVIGNNASMDFAIIEPVSRIRETVEITKGQNVDDLDCWFEYKP